MKVKYKLVQFSGLFTFEGIDYIKTSFNRGYYWKDNRKVFRTFKKSIEVEVTGDYYV